MIEFGVSTLSLQAKMGHDSQLYAKICERIFNQFKKNLFLRKMENYSGLSTSTVISYCEKFQGLWGNLSVMQPNINSVQERHQVLWAWARIRWPESQWIRVLWSDKSSCEVVSVKMDVRMPKTKWKTNQTEKKKHKNALNSTFAYI